MKYSNSPASCLNKFYFEKTSILILTFLTIVTSIFSQKAKFQSISVTEGLCHPFVYNISQDKNGFIWIGTGDGLCRYDGIDFVTSSSFDSLPADVVNVSFSDNLGKLWFGYNNGEVWSYDGNYFESFKINDKLNISVTGFAQSEDEGIIVATQNQGLFYFDSKGNSTPFVPYFDDKLITTIHLDGQRLFVGTQEGLFYCNLPADKGSSPIEIADLNYIKIQVIRKATKKNTYYIGTEDAGLYFLEIDGVNTKVSPVGQLFGLSYENIQDVVYDKDSNLLVCSYTSGLIKLILDQQNRSIINSVEKYNVDNGLSSNFIKCALIDKEKNTWLGTYGNGLALQTSQAFVFYGYEKTGLSSSVLSVAANDDFVWLAGENGILQIDKKTSKNTFLSTSNGLPRDKITSIFYKHGQLWAGTGTHGIYNLTSGSFRFLPFFVADNSLGNSINHLTGDDENIYAATKNGIYVITVKTKQSFLYSTLNGLPHNVIEQLYLDSENRLLFATNTNGIYEVNERGEVEPFLTASKYSLDFNTVTQDSKGNIWAGTYGQGVFLFLNDSVVNLTSRDGLKSNYCYSIISDDSMYVWVGHRQGLSRIDISNLSVSVFDVDNGITGDFNHNASLMVKNQLFFGTTDGLVTYNVKDDYKASNFPKSNFLHVFISEKEIDFRKPIILPFSAYKLRIDFVGLNFADPEAVRYQYKLEGYDLDWSEISDLRFALYPRIEDGEYTFLLKSFGSDGLSSETPLSLYVKIKRPFWKTWWFISLMVLAVILILIAVIKYRERKQRQIQEYLEQRLDERTREVVEQKEEIEVKNRDITDSINYAQRIQTSILPPIKRLQQHFSGSFIFYQPRDIVSGDFYWFDKLKENKFVIVCADSTGHGVPGAFMSMIGTTLIKDVCMRSDINAPSEMLRQLDIELRNTLNQNVDAEQSNDGMDGIVCEIDIRTNYLRYASAMRPMIVYKGGEQIYIKGSRSSVGGQYDKDEKDFKDEGIQLDKGDLIYMFSDGYPDQFGGTVGKKFKMVRLKNLLKDIYQKPMEEQYEYVKSTFNLWKEEFDQVDDVLFMGIKI
jgi:ligand-binding sensor domain-containing protein/serine phosphatase RsbU (regulator of sigma subunit)